MKQDAEIIQIGSVKTTEEGIDDGNLTDLTKDQVQVEQMTTTIGSKEDPLYTREEFYQAFKSVFQYCGDQFDIKSMPIRPEEEQGARVTANRIYDMAEKYAFMRFMINKNSSRVLETILMIQFITGKASAVWKEKTNMSLGSILWKRTKKALHLTGKKQTESESEYSEPVDPEKQQKQEV